MRNLLILGTTLSLAFGMSGCVTTARVQSIPANDAVTHGLTQLYKQPNYKVQTTLQLTQLNFSTAPNDTNQTASESTTDQATSKKPSGQEIEQIAGWVETILKRNEFGFDGVVDLQHQQLAITPQMSYKAVNAGGYVRVPMIFDFANSKGYADLSALSPLLVNSNSDGKYSQFSFQPLTNRIDFKKLFTWSQDVAIDNARKFDPQMFRDLPLEPADTALGGKRKIQLTLTFQELMSVNRAVFDAHRAEFLAAIKPNPKPLSNNTTRSADKTDDFMNGFIDGITSMGTVYGQGESKPMPFNINGTFHKIYLLDRAGRLLQSRIEGVLHSDSKSPRSIKMGFDSITNYSQYGSARIVMPTAQNTVLLSESTKGTVVDLAKASYEKYKKKAADKKSAESSKP